MPQHIKDALKERLFSKEGLVVLQEEEQSQNPWGCTTTGCYLANPCTWKEGTHVFADHEVLVQRVLW